MKHFANRIIICLVPVLISITVIGWAYNRYMEGRGGFRLGVDLVGGTILVYEVDPSKLAADGEKPNAEQLAASLKKRIDPADLYNVTIRPVQGDPPRVEIILPTGGRQQALAREIAWKDLLSKVTEAYPPGKDEAGNERSYDNIPAGQVSALIQEVISYTVDKKNAEEAVKKEGEIDKFVRELAHSGSERRSLDAEGIENIKNLISQQGRLEFRILANRSDDSEAINAATAYLRDPAHQAELKRLAILGEPPPPPRNPNGDATFTVDVGGEPAKHSYSWVELGKEELYSLHLNSAAKDSRLYKDEWERVAKAREAGEPTSILTGCLLYSRAIPNPERLTPKDRGKQYEYFVLTRNPEPNKEITGDYLSSARPGPDERGQLAVHFTFKTDGANLFHELTTRNKPAKEGGFKRHLAIVLDGQIRSAPTLNSPIRSSGQITGDFTKKEVDTLVTILRAGALPATLRPQPVSESTMGATLGEDTIRSGTVSVGLAFIAVMAFMAFYYKFAGFVACVALLANLLLTVAFMVLVQATFTLPGLAGLVLTLGMAVDANVLIYERLREERERGASLSLALRNGYDRAFPTIIDTHLSSIFTAVVLYVVGNDQLKGFGISLTVGLVISLFTSLYMTRTMFDIWQYKGWLHKLSMRQLFHRPNIDFMGIRNYWLTATVVLTVLGGALFIYRLDKGALNIDFVGGTAYSGQLTKPMDITELRNALHGADLEELSIEQVFVSDPEFSQGNKSKLFTVRTPERDAEKVMREINAKLGDGLRRIELKDFKIDVNNSRATLEFVNPSTGEPDYASKAQVTRILDREFKKNGIDAKQFRLDRAAGSGEKEGRFTKMQLELGDPVDPAKLKASLEGAKAEFARQSQPERLENFDSQLAASTRERALYAVLASWAAILMYLWFRFGNWTFGMAAVMCLIHDLFFTLGVIAGAHYLHGSFIGNALGLQDFKIDLPAIAALLTLVGYSVNDTIVVFDRIREVRGKNPHLTAQMINDSVNQTLSRTVLASLTVWLVVIVLYIWGGEGVHLFAFVMVVGVIIGTYSSIYVASPLLLIFGEGGREHRTDTARATAQVAATDS